MDFVFSTVAFLVTPLLFISVSVLCLAMEMALFMRSILKLILESLFVLFNLARICFFLWRTCRNRGPDHGVAHGFSVSAKAVRIRLSMFKEIKGDVMIRLYLVIGAALLHDVKDKKCRKYRPVGRSEDYFDKILAQFMATIYRGDDMMKIISNISYSQEQELKEKSLNGIVDWRQIFNGDHDLINDRHAVSDADRLSSLGEEGPRVGQNVRPRLIFGW